MKLDEQTTNEICQAALEDRAEVNLIVEELSACNDLIKCALLTELSEGGKAETLLSFLSVGVLIGKKLRNKELEIASLEFLHSK